MLKNTTYKEKFLMLQPWIPHIIDSIKKDLKNEHLKKDWQFCKQYLPGKSLNKLSLEDLVEAYSLALQKSENAEALAEFISNRWLLRNGELYSYFETKLSEINPNFSEIDSIDADKARDIIKGSVELCGPVKTYLFSVINSVVFPEEVYTELNKQAQNTEEKEEAEGKIISEKMSMEAMQRAYEQQIARLIDKYEKKLAGVQKKYIQDTEGLKKQLSQLQRKAAVN
jgi:hypothetical protein